jgi:hypothetical protein
MTDPRGWIEITWDDGSMYREPEKLSNYDEEYPFVEGIWTMEQIDNGKGFGYGILEAWAQSDMHSGIFYRVYEGNLNVTQVRTWIE